MAERNWIDKLINIQVPDNSGNVDIRVDAGKDSVDIHVDEGKNQGVDIRVDTGAQHGAGHHGTGQHGTDHQGRSDGRRMSQPPCLGDGCIGPDQCLIRKAETEKDDAQIRLCYHLGVASGLRAKRVVGIWIVKRQGGFQMRSG